VELSLPEVKILS